MQRVAVVGSGGAGKSTFARELGGLTGIPVIHLDQYYWRPGWVETPPEDWRTLQRDLLGDSSWIVDGNYGGTLDVRLSRADTVIVLALPRLQCFVGVLRRIIRNHGRDIQAAGCAERLNLAFLRWVWRWPGDSRPRLDAAIDLHRDRLQVIELTSRQQVSAFLLDSERAPSSPTI